MTYFRFPTFDKRYFIGVEAEEHKIAWQQFCKVAPKKLIEINLPTYLRKKPKSKNRGNIMFNFLANRL